MSRKLRMGTAPVGVPRHTAKVNSKNVGFDEDYLNIKTYGRSVFFNDRYVCEATRDVIFVLVPHEVRIGRIKAVQGAWLEVGHY